MPLPPRETLTELPPGHPGASSLDGAVPRPATGGVAAVARALLILGAFRPGDSALPLRVLAARTGLYKSTILRLLASLERTGAVLREADASWSPGPMLYHWGTFYLRGQGLEARAQPIVDGLAEDTGAIAAFWARLDAERRICVFRALPPRIPRLALSAGDVMPMGNQATARVFAAWERRGVDSNGRPEVLTAPGSRDGEPTSLSAAVFGLRERFIGALTLSGTGDRFLGDLDRARALLGEAAAALTRSQGGGSRG